MSTILKSAAMSLLSKTLQAFLSKYLSDVDVEGVALPSMYDGSGWGVRLSNVKLRDGVQLMERMPGKRKRRRKRNKKKRTNFQQRTAVAEGTGQSTGRAFLPESLSEPLDEPLRSGGDRGDPPRGHNEVHEFQRLRDTGRGDSNSDESNMRTSRSRINSYEDLEISVRTTDNQLASPISRPSTPEQDSKSIFSCFTKGKKKGKSIPGGIETTDHSNTEEGSLAETPISVMETQMYGKFSSLAMDEKKGNTNFDDSLITATENKEDEESDGEDEFEDYEQPYRLCVGDSGRIGTLDIRLVDKELHVLVEDALLTIECYPIPEASPDSAAKGGDAGFAGADNAATAGVGPPPTPDPANTKAKTKTEPKRDSVGDRVLADNSLARAIAAIPHLFLRDVRIRFVLRQEPLEPKSARFDQSVVGAAAGSSVEGVPERCQPGPEDTMLEVGIDFLAVSNGEDVLSIFQQPQDDMEHDGESPHGDDVPLKSQVSLSTSTSTTDNAIDHNEYMVRHIRTGRGSDAGIWVQVFSPTPKLPARTTATTIDGPLWARQRWAQATSSHLLRCSGLDVRARIHLGTKKQVSSYSWFFDYDDEYEEYNYDNGDIDSMLVGFDSIAPGMPSLPPMTPSMSRGDTPIRAPRTGQPVGSTEEIDAPAAMYPGSEKFTLDDNDIQSCKIPSTFHRISRGLRPGSCKDCLHLPSESCDVCWDGAPTVPRGTPLDSSMPLPGLALQVTVRDPLEINVDRPSIETLNLLKTLFVKKQDANTHNLENISEMETEASKTMARLDSTASVATAKSTAAKSSFFNFFSSTKAEEEIVKNPMESFSPIMQPESIQVLGLHLTRILFRVHFLRDDREDDGLSFSYWDLLASCVTIDQQSLKSHDIISQDLRFEIGYCVLKEFYGVEHKELAEFGAPLTSRGKSLISTSKSLNDDHLRNKTPWPSAACALMDIPPPQETLMYKDRQGHGVQLRLISVKKPYDKKDVAISMLNARLGCTTVNVPWGFWRDLLSVKRKIISGILGVPEEVPQGSPTPLQGTEKPVPTLMAYSVQIDGGTITMLPLIDVKAPTTRLAGELSSEAGISFATVLNDLEVAYGCKAPSSRRGLTIQQLAALPESVRTRILFCMDDWTSFEDALEVKNKELKNPFKRTMAINKAISKASKGKGVQRPGEALKKTSMSREDILANLTKLNDEELNKLWLAHQGFRWQKAV